MFLDLRLTPCKIESWLDATHIQSHRPITFHLFLTDLKEYIKPTRMLVGLEHLDKFGKETHYHYHINMECEDKTKDSVQKWLRAREISGKAAYCVRVFADVDDVERWFRYPLKENGLQKYSMGFSSEDYSLLEIKAKDEKQRTALKNCEDLTKLMNKNQFRDKMFNNLKELYPTILSDKQLFSIIGKYYQNENKTPPFSKLLDVVMDFKVFNNWMTFEEYYENKYE